MSPRRWQKNDSPPPQRRQRAGTPGSSFAHSGCRKPNVQADMLSACAEYEDFKSLYSMLPDSKSGRTLSKGTRSMRLAPPQPPVRNKLTACARACSLSKQSGERRANNQSAQGIALGICLYVSVAPLGQNNEKQFPLPTAFCVGSYSFALSGRYPCCILSRRALPWADISLPLRGANCSGGYVIRLS